MERHVTSSLPGVAALLIACSMVLPSRGDELTPAELNFFETKIRPVLIRECFGCHSNKSGNVRGGLRLDSKQLMLIGGGSGPAIVPGDVEESLLYGAITHETLEMPPKRKLPPNVIDDFRKWIEMGAPDPRVNAVANVKSTITTRDIEQAKASFWAYQPPLKREPPEVEKSAWPRTDVDRFVLAKLEQRDMTPPADAEPAKVVRRLSFDVVGLPPTPEQARRFLEDWQDDPDRAITVMVDELLGSERYGERWGRHWLDVARYAESTGRGVNMAYPQAWRYRDYVIDSFNDDKPFDRFVQEQLAGDLLPAKSDEDWARNLVATTFLAIGAKDVNEGNATQFAANLVDEQIDATTRVFLATSVACARCHDHKFDAIPQTDYYAMAGIFQNMETFYGNPQSELGAFKGAQEKQTSTLLILPTDDPSPFDRRLSVGEVEQLRNEIYDVRRQMMEMRRSGGARSANAQRQRAFFLNRLAALSARLASVDGDGKPISFCMGVQEGEEPRDARVLVRGEIDQPAQTVPRGFPQVLTNSPVRISEGASGRLELARWIGSAENPLTARVMVNRIWLHLIGRGIVTTMENFGTTGQPPSHPDLLDHLAVRFVESGWSVKAIVREIITSRIYRMQTTFNEKYHEIDPDNALVWRANPRRLDAEAIRDAMLSVSGEIDLDRPRASIVASAGYSRVQNGRLGQLIGGVPGRSAGARGGAFNRLGPRPQPGAFRPGGRGASGRRPGGLPFRRRGGAAASNPLEGETSKFRSVYLPVVREEEPRSLRVFDFSDTSAITGQREASNTPNQSLFMMNNPFVLQQSRAFAARVARQASATEERIQLGFGLAYGRSPTPGELAATKTFYRRFTASGADPETTLSAFCQSLLAAAEFRYLD